MPACMASGAYLVSNLSPIGRSAASPQIVAGSSGSSAICRRTGVPILTDRRGWRKAFLAGSKASSASSSDRVRDNGLSVRADGSGSDSSSATTTTADVAEKTELDRLFDGMTFGELCDEFECISSPAVEASARQLAKDILELREGNRALGTYAVFVKYEDPLRSFTGREKYKRPSWFTTALDNPVVAVQEMAMGSSSTLTIKWTVGGKPRIPPATFGGEVILSITSTFTLNQISGQVINQRDEWDLSKSPPLAQAYFWATRLSYSAIEAGKDFGEAVSGVSNILDKEKDDRSGYYPDPSGDPRKFFQMDDNPQRDLYQIGLLLALIYLLVQFLKVIL